VVRVYDAQTGAAALALKGPQGLSTPAFSPDGARIAAAGEDGVVRVYEAQTGVEVLALKGAVRLGTPVFSPDGTRIAARGEDRLIRVHDARTDAEILAFKGPGTLLSLTFSPDGQRIAAGGGAGPVMYDAPRDTTSWQAERRKALLVSIPAWHQSQAVARELSGQWFAAAFHWGRLALAEPTSGQPHFRRGLALANLAKTTEAHTEFETALVLKKDLGKLDQADAHAMLEQWAEAAKLYEEAVVSPNVTVRIWLRYALLRLQQGDQEGYRKACTLMIGRFGKSRNASEANTIAWICVLRPEALPDLKPAVELAQLAVRDDPTHANHNTLGGILYRAGQYKDAVAELKEAIKLNNQDGMAADFLFLAMAHHRLGQADEAHQWLDRARQELEKHPPVFWSKQVEYQLFRSEAETLIEGKAPDPKK
jgi:tetratricopeptide (TPR) repeat protein